MDVVLQFQFEDAIGKSNPSEQNFFVRIMLCFSVNINGRKILNTDVQGHNQLECLNGIRLDFEAFSFQVCSFTLFSTGFRVLSMIWVIVGHVYVYLGTSEGF